MAKYYNFSVAGICDDIPTENESRINQATTTLMGQVTGNGPLNCHQSNAELPR